MVSEKWKEFKTNLKHKNPLFAFIIFLVRICIWCIMCAAFLQNVNNGTNKDADIGMNFST